MDHHPSLDRDFDSPILRSRLETLLLLASSLKPYLAVLDAEDFDWMPLVEKLATAYSSEISEVKDPSAALNIWKIFESSQIFGRATEREHKIFAEARKKLADQLNGASSPLDYLAEANSAAHAWVRTLLASRNCDGLLGESPTSVSVRYDRDGRMYCAAASRMVDSIAWAWQPQRHALWGALAAQEVFQHEYLSHLVPRYTGAWLEVREGWLFSTLIAEIHDRMNLWKVKLYNRFRKSIENWMVEQSGPINGFEVFGPLGMDNGARSLRLYSEELLWQLTAELLMLESTAEARSATRLIYRLSDSNTAEFKQLLAVGLQINRMQTQRSSQAPWPGLMAFCRRIEDASEFP